jgi:hypothetical protein
MMSEDEPKSAIELAMEKLRARGDFVETPLTDAQKTEIADTRSFYRARVAEIEIQEESKMRQVASLEELEALKEALAKEKERLNREMEDKVQRIRGAKPTEK